MMKCPSIYATANPKVNAETTARDREGIRYFRVRKSTEVANCRSKRFAKKLGFVDGRKVHLVLQMRIRCSMSAWREPFVTGIGFRTRRPQHPHALRLQGAGSRSVTSRCANAIYFHVPHTALALLRTLVTWIPTSARSRPYVRFSQFSVFPPTRQQIISPTSCNLGRLRSMNRPLRSRSRFATNPPGYVSEIRLQDSSSPDFRLCCGCSSACLP
jgi:hypothetical protein